MKNTTILLFASLTLCLGITNLRAGDEEFTRLVGKWTGQRDVLVVNIVRSWLRGASAQSLKPDIIQLVNLESRLAVNSGTELYMNHFSDAKDPEKTLADLVRTYLRRRGIEFQTKDFLVGKEFKIYREEVRPVDVGTPDSGSRFQFQLWGNSKKTGTTSK